MAYSRFHEDLLKAWLESSQSLSTIILSKIERNVYASPSGIKTLQRNYKITVAVDSFWMIYHFIRILCKDASGNSEGTNVLKDIYPIAVLEFRKHYDSRLLSEEYFISRNSGISSEEDFDSKGGTPFEDIDVLDTADGPGGLIYHFSQRICFAIIGERLDILFMIIMCDLAHFFGMTRNMLLEVLHQHKSIVEGGALENRETNWRERANNMFDLEDYEGIIALLTRTISLEPNLAEAYYFRGVAMGLLNDHHGAIADLTKAIDLKPDFHEAYSSRAVAYIGLHQRSKARADLVRLVAMGHHVPQQIMDACNE